MTNPDSTKAETKGFGVGLLHWLQTTQGIVAAVAAILASLGAIASISENITPNTSGEIFPQKFQVSANSQTGYTYTYPKNEKQAKLEYTTSGRWTAIPIDETKEIVPRGEIDADGYTGFEPNPSKPCRDFNTGALVVKKNNNNCIAVGRTGSFDVEPGDSFTFVMNDNYRLYKDNEGEMSITLSKKKS
jgi:hypothetical protein